MENFREIGFNFKEDYIKNLTKELLSYFKKIDKDCFDYCSNFRIFISSPNKKKFKDIDYSNEQKGFLYYISIREINSDMQTRKIGISLNPILRLGQHKYKNYIKSSNNIIRVIECYDYLKCEAEIKKLTNGKEVFEWNKELSLKVKKIMDKYVCTELDPTTIEILVNSPSLKKYFDKK